VLEAVVRSGVAGMAVDDVAGPAALDRIDAVEQSLQCARLWIRRVPGKRGEASDCERPVCSGDELPQAPEGDIEPAVRAHAGVVGLVREAAGRRQVNAATRALRGCAISAGRVDVLGSALPGCALGNGEAGFDEAVRRGLRQFRAAPHRRPILQGAAYAQCVLCARGARDRREWFRMDSIVCAR